LLSSSLETSLGNVRTGLPSSATLEEVDMLNTLLGGNFKQGVESKSGFMIGGLVIGKANGCGGNLVPFLAVSAITAVGAETEI